MTKIFIGGLGAIMPLILNLLSVDLEVAFSKFSNAYFIGYTIRTLLLFGLGALIVYLNTEVKKPWNIFLLGMSAPALLLNIINANNIKEQSKAAENKSATTHLYTPELKSYDGFTCFFFNTASAQVAPAAVKPLPPTPVVVVPAQSRMEKFWDGFFGKSTVTPTPAPVVAPAVVPAKASPHPPPPVIELHEAHPHLDTALHQAKPKTP